MVTASIGLTKQEKHLVKKLLERLAKFQRPNRIHESYYDGSFTAQMTNISTPEHLVRMLQMVSGWAGTAVDVLEERLDLLGFNDDNLLPTFEDNALDEEAGQVHLDAMIYGIGFVSATAGGDGEPDHLIRGHDAKNTTGILNSRTRRLDSALTREVKDGETIGIELWLPDQIVTARRDRQGAVWQVTDRQFHGLGVVPMVAFVNRARTGDRGGKSEITAPLRRYTDAAVRALVSMDINREFFSVPQRYAIGLDQSDFVGPDGRPLSQWQTVTGRIWATGPVDEQEREPKLGEFSPQPAGPYLEQIQGLATLAAAEAGIPGHYFGLRGDQATSADAIRAMEARLVKRAERRQKTFGRSWTQVADLVLAARGDAGSSGGVRWGDPATPTIAATTDAIVKQVQAGVVPNNSRAVWDRLGYSPEEQRIMAADIAQQQSLQRAALLANRVPSGGGPEFQDEGVEGAVGELPGYPV